MENAKVDPRVELISITFRLADAEEFKSTYFESYVEDINTYLLQPNYRDENVDYQPNYKYFSIPQ
ncbi:MAG: DUF4932 domain-containing protein [Flavobacterium lindanitolerans]|uniref:hypothetical protein n=1 Tax=Flavobacterium lindanitolerans TaxID=428988 RepID=UPI001A3FF645|nr:hypothetical protein [Flavobacterium lindanitolerans]MBL7869654.1 DUF4932 domain-containing protein [Flavobacterium lindanitolerans]